MIKTNIVFVLGAGASFPYHYPLGEMLIQELEAQASSEFFQKTLASAFVNYGRTMVHPMVTKYLDFVSDLLRSKQPSVDQFLQMRPEYADIGKFGIAYRLNSVERTYEDKFKYENDWYKYLFNQMFETDFESFLKNKVSFVTFNYDISLEKFFLNSIEQSFKNINHDPRIFFENVKIIHVHGKLRKFDWEDRNEKDFFVVNASPGQLKKMASGIQLYHEANNDQTIAEAIRVMGESEIVFFLGFGFHQSNVRKILRPGWHKNVKKILSTSVGITVGEQKRVNRSYFVTPVDFPKVEIDCLRLLRESADLLI